MADTNLLRRALHCILDNALKFTAQRSVAHIAIAVEVQDGADNHRNALVTLSIQDNGAGFNPAMQDRLFKPFQRLHTTRQFPGIGMGLALTHKIAQRMNGAVTIEGTPDAGCRVQLSLPAA
jgi:signal transduction histidine kinase